MALMVHSYYDPGGFEVLAEEWNDLLHRSAADILFLTLEYQRTWWHILGEGEVSILAVRDGGELVGVAPLFATTNPQGQRILSIVGCVEVADYLDFIGKPDSLLTDEDRRQKQIHQEHERWKWKYEKGKEKSENLNNRFADWYYVISGASFDKLNLNRQDLVVKKES